MRTVSAREANQQFSRLLTEVANGEDVVITRDGQPVATLSPYRTPRIRRVTRRAPIRSR